MPMKYDEPPTIRPDGRADYNPSAAEEAHREIVPIKDVATSVAAYHDAAGDLIGIDSGLPGLSRYWRVEKGSLIVLTGIPGAGKSELIDQIAVETIATNQWRWLFLSPENLPLRKHAAKIVEKSLSMPFGRMAGFRMSAEDAYAECQRLGDTIRFLHPDPDTPIDLAWINAKMREAYAKAPYDAMVLDPWSEMEFLRPAGMSESEYTGQTLTMLRRYGRQRGIALFVVAHPTKLAKGTDGKYPVPTPYDISGSSHWRNKADVCLSVWRDYEAAGSPVQVHVQKIRNRLAGELGVATVHWSRVTGRYYGDAASMATAEATARTAITEREVL